MGNQRSIRILFGPYAKELQFSERTIVRAVSILEQLKGGPAEDDFSRARPKTLAAAILYIAGCLEMDKRTQEEVSEVCGINPVSLRRVYKKFVGYLEGNQDN